MKVFIGSDHRGFEVKNHLVSLLTEQGIEVVDLGPDQLDPDDDYNDYAVKVALEVQKVASEGDTESRGILVCGSAHGVAIQANRFKGVRAIAAYDTELARIGREHNDANVLCLSADFIESSDIDNIVNIFLNTAFSGEERHIRRIKKLDA
ncbi:RpiB/LacA/LacB family sugar-phosphate isomerase [Candidatus Saccharibacteria bacterium]|nr:RpiB/LacA/LacB family sugar-phosphate isomerase [Candidatus Saccharibacteria bacterium]